MSDNFAPWYIRKGRPEFFHVELFRGSYYFTRLIELGIVGTDALDDLIGTYSLKEINRIKERVELIPEMEEDFVKLGRGL